MIADLEIHFHRWFMEQGPMAYYTGGCPDGLCVRYEGEGVILKNSVLLVVSNGLGSLL